MSIFTKPISQLTASDLNDLLAEKAVENLRLEFKLQTPDKDETLKKVSAFANTYGGLMVVGAEADSADGRIQGLPGVDPVRGYKQKVVQWCFDAATPPLTVGVSDPIAAPAGDGRVCYVISVPESDLAPHFLNGRKGVYVRTDEFSGRFEARLADERELAHLLDRRKLIAERRMSLVARARDRFAVYYGSKGGNTARPRLEISVVPRFPARPVCEQHNLGPCLMTNRIPLRHGGFPHLTGGTISQHESVIMLDPVAEQSLLEANVWGMLFYGVPIDFVYQKFSGIHLYGFVGLVLACARHSGTVLKALGYSGAVVLQASLAQIRGVPWLQAVEGPYITERGGSSIDDSVLLSTDATTESLLEDPDSVALNLLRFLLFAVNMADLVDAPHKIEDLLKRGYEYNFWGPPTPRV